MIAPQARRAAALIGVYVAMAFLHRDCAEQQQAAVRHYCTPIERGAAIYQLL
jgi:hypothetical protein